MLHYINQCTAARRNGKLSRRLTKHSLQSICFKFSDTLCGIKHADNSRTRKNGIKLIPDQQFVLRSGTVINHIDTITITFYHGDTATQILIKDVLLILRRLSVLSCISATSVIKSHQRLNLLRHGASPLKSDSTMCCNDAAVRMQGEL